MIIESEVTFEAQTEQEVEYKVNSGTPPPDVEEPPTGGPCDIFDDTWRPLETGQPVGPCPPPMGQRPPWAVRFRWIDGETIEEIPTFGPVYANASSRVILKGEPGSFTVEVVTPGG